MAYQFFQFQSQCKTKKVTAGLIFDPVRHEYFFAESGSGAFLNDRRIRVSGRRNMTDAIFSTCTPDFVDNKTSDREYFSKKLENIMLASAGVRVFGSASLDLAYVAAGRYDGFWGQGLNDNAIAAGILIIREAGGFVSDFTSRDLALRSGNIVAANPAIHAKLLKRLSKKEY